MLGMTGPNVGDLGPLYVGMSDSDAGPDKFSMLGMPGPIC